MLDSPQLPGWSSLWLSSSWRLAQTQSLCAEGAQRPDVNRGRKRSPRGEQGPRRAPRPVRSWVKLESDALPADPPVTLTSLKTPTKLQSPPGQAGVGEVNFIS